MNNDIFNNMLNMIFPNICGVCGKLGNSYICKRCLKDIELLEYNITDKYLGKAFQEHFWIFRYNDKIRNMIVDYKFNDKSYLYRTFVEIIDHDEKAITFLKNADIIIPIPIHKKRYKSRGYNQCCLIANKICNKIDGIEYRDDILIKVKNINPQSALNKKERKENIRGAFYVNKLQDLKNKKILLIDDVYTTGNTVNECARILKLVTNCEKINVFTIAKD